MWYSRRTAGGILSSSPTDPAARIPELELELARALQRAEAADRRARVLYDGASDPMLEIDGAGVVRGVNGAAVRRFGSSIVGKDLSELFRPGDSETVERMFAGAMEQSLDRELQLIDGDTAVFRGVVPSASGRAVVVLNTGSREGGASSEDQRRQAAVGRMAALLAHELNNPLTVLQLRTDLLVEDASGDAAREQLDLLVQGVARLARSVKTFQRVARAPKAQRDPVQVAELVDRAIGECGAASRVALEAVPSGFLVAGDEDGLGLALEMLLRVATEGAAARVRVEGFNQTVRVEIVSEPGSSKRPVVPRSARGEDRSHELAFAVADLVARDHGGEVRTLEREGATVLRLELPRAIVGADGDAETPPGRGRPPARLLVVDDEPLVGAVLSDWCVRNGHACRLAVSAEEAVVALAEGVRFDAVLVDERLPGASGAELLAWIEREHPELLGRAALMSGAAPHPASPASASGGGRHAFLPKPFTRRQLADLVEALLAR